MYQQQPTLAFPSLQHASQSAQHLPYRHSYSPYNIPQTGAHQGPIFPSCAQQAVQAAPPVFILPEKMELCFDDKLESFSYIYRIKSVLIQNPGAGLAVRDLTLFTGTVDLIRTSEPTLKAILSRLTNLHAFRWIYHHPIRPKKNFRCSWEAVPTWLRSMLLQAWGSPKLTLKVLELPAIEYLPPVVMSSQGLWRLKSLQLTIPMGTLSLQELNHLHTLDIHLGSTYKGDQPFWWDLAGLSGLISTASTATLQYINIRVEIEETDPDDRLNRFFDSAWQEIDDLLGHERSPFKSLKQVAFQITSHKSVMTTFEAKWNALMVDGYLSRLYARRIVHVRHKEWRVDLRFSDI